MKTPAALFDITGRLALITGSSAGIGLALAEGLARAGARVVVNGRSAERVETARSALAGKGFDAIPLVFDVTDEAALTRQIEALVADHGAPDILVNNAGIQHRAPLHEFPSEAFRRVIDTNLVSAFSVAKAVVPSMIDKGRGTIINICSVQSELVRPGIAPYAASKGGLKMLTKGMALDWGKHGIRANGLAPGYFRTELNAALVDNPDFSSWLEGRTPLGRWGDVEELLGAALFLASDASSFVTGHMLYVDGGITACL